mgnify:CR=1 FL=1
MRVSQFVISIGLIIITLIINQQVDYIQSKDLGFDKENVLVIQNDREIDERREEFKTFIRPNSRIQEASFSTGIPGLPQYMRRDFSISGREGTMGINWFQADDSFLTTMDVSITQNKRRCKTVNYCLYSVAVIYIDFPSRRLTSLRGTLYL